MGLTKTCGAVVVWMLLVVYFVFIGGDAFDDVAVGSIIDTIAGEEVPGVGAVVKGVAT